MPLAAAVGGGLLSAGLSGYATHQAENKQDKAAAEGIKRQQEIQRQASARVAMLLDALKGSNPGQYQPAINAQYQGQLADAMPQASAGLHPVVSYSDAYSSDAAGQQGATADWSRMLASQLARVDAPVRQRQEEGFRIGDAGADLDVFKRKSSGENALTDLKVKSIQPNPWMMLISNMASRAGNAAASAYGGGGY